MAHVVIIGASTGGLPAAYEMKEALGKAHRVTVVSNVDYFQFVPSNPWVGVGWRDRSQITFKLAEPLKRKGIHFIPKAVTRIDADASRLALADGQTLDYDYLVIATGPKLAFDEVPGLGPAGHTHSVCTIDHAEQTHEAFEAFCKDPGPIVIGAVQMASCFGPAYEFAGILDTELRRRKIRHKVPMTYVSPEPYIGHLGLGGVGDSQGMMESELRHRHVKWITNAKVNRVEAGKMFVQAHGEEAEREVPFKFAMMLPAFKGVDAVAAVPGLCNPRGFVLVDENQRNPTHGNIFALGVCVAIPPVEATPVPTGTPKTGYMIETMATAIVHNVRHALRGEAPEAVPTWSALCLADFGDTGAAFIASPQIPPRNLQWMRKGKWVHLAKIAFEKYFIRKMKKGDTEPIYERLVLKRMGIERLK
ncbi:MAG: FAD-dependent oxidoreductase [Nitrospirae bacterium]|nr:FAD-dependent oxidoreductase [Nitrospirota bacterium]